MRRARRRSSGFPAHDLPFSLIIVVPALFETAADAPE
jgi:hypothetical protein